MMRRAGFTLVETVLGVLASSILMIGMISSIYMAMQSVESGTSLHAGVDAGVALDSVRDQIGEALVFVHRRSNSIEFLMQDRRDDGTLDRILYWWSGTPGDPLYYRQQTYPPEELIPNVHDFSLTYVYQAIDTPPRVLLVLPTNTPNSVEDHIRVEQFREWSFPVETISASASKTQFEFALSRNDVVYICENITSDDLNTKLRYSGRGCVWEECMLNDDFGLSSWNTTHVTSQISVTNNSHYITALFPLGTLQIVKSNHQMIGVSGNLSPDYSSLAKLGTGTKKSLAIMDFNAGLEGGGIANGRRVMLPVATGNFVFGDLTHDGLVLVKRAIEWAAGFDRLVRVDIELQQTNEELGWTRTQVRPVNIPRVSGR